MKKSRLSRSAKADLLSIGAYTLRNWGPAQALRYLNALEGCVKLLAGNPMLGRPCNWIRPGLYRFEKENHVLFYRLLGDGILVSRILHQEMMPDRELFDDAPQDD
jgi:toxin ParE1/3/4